MQEWKDKIDAMSHEDLARLWRFAAPGHPVFVAGSALWKHFEARHKAVGGMTPQVSKKIGWVREKEPCRLCKQRFDPNGDGWDGMCPMCADKAEENKGGAEGAASLDAARALTLRRDEASNRCRGE